LIIPCFSFLPGSGSADLLAANLADAALIAEVTGLGENEARKIVAASAPAASLVRGSASLVKIAIEAASDSLRKARWRTGITRIVEQTRNRPALSRVRDEDRWEKLIASGVVYIEDCVRECA
jgi:hypothetical protein